MTEHHLSTLVRDHVTVEEPPFPSPHDVITRGRRRVRLRRNLRLGIVGLTMVVALGAAVALRTPADTSQSDPSIDPLTQQALENYNAQRMPTLMDREAREVFSRSVADLGPADFEAADYAGRNLAPQSYDRASAMSIHYGLGAFRILSVTLSHARSEAEGDAQQHCDNGLADGIYLECTVESRPQGTVITKLTAVHQLTRSSGVIVPADQIAGADPNTLWFKRTVKVVKSDTFQTYVDETVQAPTQDAAEANFTVPVEDLEDLSLNPLLVIPEPPPPPASG